MSAATRMARRRQARGHDRAGASETCPVHISEAPTTPAEVYALERACLTTAKKMGKRGGAAKLAAARFYAAAVAEAKHLVRDPATQKPIVKTLTGTVKAPPIPRGMDQLESGLYVPHRQES